MADQLAVTITAHDEATRTLRSIQSELKGLHGSMTQTGVVAGAVGGAITAGLGAALNSLSSIMSGVGHATVGMNSSLEQSQIAFETMLGSATKAQTFLSDLQDFAAKTPFQFPELVDASKKMLAFGFTAEQVRPVLTAVGNAAAAMGSGAEGIDRITRALGQMQAKGMVQAEEILQLTEAGIPAWDMLAKKLNTDVAGAMDAVTKRTVTAATFLEAFQAGTAARFGDMMERQSHTFAGAMSTVQDVIGQLIGGSFQPFFVQISRFADELAQGLGGDAFQTWATNVQEVLSRLGPLFGQFMDVFKGLGPVIQQFVNDHIQGFVAGVQSMGERVLSILPAIGEMFGHLGERIERGLGIAGPIIEKVAGILGTLVGPAGDLLGAVERLSDAVQDRLTGALSQMQGPAQEVLQALTNLQPLFTTIGEIATRAFGDVQLAVQQVRDIFGPTTVSVDDLSGSISSMVAEIVPAIQSFADTAHEAFSSFMETAVNAWNAISPTLQDLRDWLATNIPVAIGALREQWDALGKELGPTFMMAWQVIEPILAGLKDWLGTQIPQVADTVKGAIGGLFSFIGTMVGNLAEMLGPFKDQFGGALHEFNQRVQEALAASRPVMVAEAKETATAVRQEFIQGTIPVVPALAETGEKAGEALAAGVRTGTTSAVAAVRATAPAAEHAGEEVGAALVQGVEAGMQERQGATVDRFANLMGAVIQGGRSAIRAQSPSLVAAEQIGVPLMEGIAQGFESALPATIRSMGDHLSAALTGSMGLQAKQAAQEFWNVREGMFPRETFGIGSVNSARNAEAFQSSQRAWAQEHFGTSDLSSILLPNGQVLSRSDFEKVTAQSTAAVRQYVATFGEATAPGGNMSGMSGSGFAQAPITFYTQQSGILPSGSRVTDIAQTVAQTNAAMQAWAQALRENIATIASIPQAFSAYVLHPSPGLGTGITTAGGGAAAGGMTGGGQAYGALLALGQQVVANHPELSGEAQARAIQQAMRTDQQYLRVVGTLTDTTSDLERQQAQATDDVFNLRNLTQSLGGAYAQGTGVADQLAAAEANLAAITGQLAAARTTAIAATGGGGGIDNTARNLPGILESAVTGSRLGPFSPPVLTVPSGGGVAGVGSGGVVIQGDIIVQGSGVSTAQDAATFVRQIREESRRQGIDLTRVGGV